MATEDMVTLEDWLTLDWRPVWDGPAVPGTDPTTGHATITRLARTGPSGYPATVLAIKAPGARMWDVYTGPGTVADVTAMAWRGSVRSWGGGEFFLVRPDGTSTVSEPHGEFWPTVARLIGWGE